ncbi:family 16 glycoside hydrolase [Brevibacillus gelatini]|uniref:family 16 glycoside hydrolase n=1 Tax=Brevibacillus gelatini TaxID=1655277 RepID=UPI003D81C4FE
MNLLTGISSTAVYQFRLADEYTSIRNYIGKVTFTTSPSRHYSFVYIPYGRNTSILMLDYLLAHRKSVLASVQDSLQDMIREDTRTASPTDLIVIANRTDRSKGLIFDEASCADRIIRQPLQVVRRVHVSDRLKAALGDKLPPSHLSVRLQKNALHIDLPPAAGNRSKAAKSSVCKNHLDGIRTNRLLGNKFNHWLRGERTSSFPLWLDTERSIANRHFLDFLFLQMESELGSRASARKLAIANEAFPARRSSAHALFTAPSYLLGKRHYRFEMTQHLILAFSRWKEKHTEMLRKMAWAHLKARQYDSVLHFLTTANRIGTQDLIVHEVLASLRRSSQQNASVLQQYQIGNRTFMRKLSLDPLFLTSYRAGRRDLFLNNCALEALRSYQNSAGALLDDYELSKRISKFALETLYSMFTGDRQLISSASLLNIMGLGDRHNLRTLLVDAPVLSSLRSTSTQLWIPEQTTYAQKQLLRPATSLKNNVSAVREQLHDMYLGESKQAIDLSGGKAAKPSILSAEEDIFALWEQLRPSTLHDWLAAKPQSRHAYSEEASLSLPNFKRDGFISQNSFLAALWRVLPAHILEDILASKEFPSHLMDDMLFASRLTDGQSILEALVEWALSRNNLVAQIDEQFLNGVRTRIQALLDTNIISSKSTHEKAGILCFGADEATRLSENLSRLESEELTGNRAQSNQAVVDEESIVGEEIFRPAELKIGHPFGYLTPDPSFLLDDSTADKASLPSELDDRSSDALLRNRITELCSGFLFASSVHERVSCILELYEIGEKSVRAGELPEDAWQNYAKLALEQCFVHEQMFASQPEAASTLLESILGFKQPDKAIINADWIANHQERSVDLLSPLLGQKELAEAIITQYLAAQEERRHGHIEKPLFSVRDFKKAWSDRIEEVGQGFVYDYSKEVLEAGHDPEHWSGGFAVPDTYDPHDPFNEYYPWTTNLNALELGQDDWTRFGSGTWVQDRDQGKFISKSSSGNMSGFIRNDFTYSDYQFEVDFKVDNPADGDSAGIVFKYFNDKNYWMFVASGGDASGMPRPMQLFKVENGISTLYSTPMNPFAWEKEKWYTLRVSVVGNRIRLWVDNSLQYDFTE